MSDIVSRLRSVQQLGYRTDIGQTCREAADRLELLEAENAASMTEIANARKYGDRKTAEVDRLRAEITRLQKELETAREALEPFVRQMEREFPDQWPGGMDLRSLNASRWHLKVGDFRRAGEAYRATKDTTP